MGDDDRHKEDIPENARLFIGNVNGDRVLRDDLRDLFRRYGTVMDIHINSTFAFVEMETVDQAREAKDRLNGRELMGKSMRIEFSKSKCSREPGAGGAGGGGPRARGYRILIEGIPRGTKWGEVKEWVKNKGFESTFTNAEDDIGEAEYRTEEEARDAVAKLDGLEWDGRKVHVREGRLERKPRGGDDYRSRDRRDDYRRDDKRDDYYSDRRDDYRRDDRRSPRRDDAGRGRDDYRDRDRDRRSPPPPRRDDLDDHRDTGGRYSPPPPRRARDSPRRY